MKSLSTKASSFGLKASIFRNDESLGTTVNLNINEKYDMKIKKKNWIYKVKFDGTLIEYEATNMVSRWILSAIGFNHHVTVPVNHVLHHNFRTHWWGQSIHFNVVKHTINMETPLSVRKVKGWWVFNDKHLLQILIKSLKEVDRLNQKQENVAIPSGINYTLLQQTQQTSIITESKKSKMVATNGQVQLSMD